MPEFLSLPARIAIITVCALGWLGQYFLINRATPNKLTFKIWALEWESDIPFLSQMVFPYLSVYLFAILPFFLVEETKLFIYTLLGYALITLIGSGIHIRFPSRVLRNEHFNPGGFSLQALSWYQRLCKPYDNFPSTHVAFSMLAVGIAYLDSGLMLALVLLIWALIIAISTLLTKQHYLLDVLSGAILGVAVFTLIVLLL